MYSHNNGYPVETLHRIRLSSGTTRTNVFTEEELQDAGWKIVDDKPECDNLHFVEWNYTAGEWYIREKFPYELVAERDQLWQPIIEKRNQLLAESDITQMKDSFRTTENCDVLVNMWAEYRQKLRDIPQRFSSPDSVEWPKKPTQEEANGAAKIAQHYANEYYGQFNPNGQIPRTGRF